MWVGTQTSQVEIKLSLKACQVSWVERRAEAAWGTWKAGQRRLSHTHLLLIRYTSSTYELKSTSSPAAYAWSVRGMSSMPLLAASMLGAPSARPWPRVIAGPHGNPKLWVRGEKGLSSSTTCQRSLCAGGFSRFGHPPVPLSPAAQPKYHQQGQCCLVP